MATCVRNGSLYFVKFLITTYTSILPALLPVFMENMNLSLIQAGALVSVFSLFNSLPQPFFGWIEDRLGYYYFLCLSPLAVGICMGALGYASDYSSLIVLLLLAGIGICAFHPASFSAVKAANPDSMATIIAYLLLATSLGFVVGPALVSLFVSRFGLERLYLIAVPGVLAAVGLFAILSKGGNTTDAETDAFHYPLAKIVVPIFPLFLYTLAISVTAMNLFSFVPIYLRQCGASVSTVGFFLSAFSLGSALGPLAGSLAARKIGRFPLLTVSASLSTICLIFFNLVPPAGIGQMTVFSFLGFFLMLPVAILIALAQQRAPGYTGTVSSFLGGAVWGLGGMLVVVFAKLAELTNIKWLLGGLALFPLLALVLVLAAAPSFRR